MTEGFTIQETAEQLGVSAHTLRYYEREGLVSVPRTPQGERRYGPPQLERLRFVLHLRGAGMNMLGLRQYVALVEVGADTVAERRALLVQHEQQVLDDIQALQSHLNAIRRKIERYDGHCVPCGVPESA